MGSDLVSACVFCAGMLLGMDLPPRTGLGADIGFSYATLARRYQATPERVDSSDTTPKFVLIGLGGARAASELLGAGTPQLEWRIRVAFAAPHAEQELKASPDLARVAATGDGRYENFAVLGRLPLGARDSVELAIDRRFHQASQLVNIGEENHVFSEQRTYSAERIDAAAGWRHRWTDLEAAAALRWVKPGGFNATANAFHDVSGAFFGGDAEVRFRRGAWTLLLHGERMAGSLDVHRESAPSFANRDSREPASLSAVRLGVGYAWPRTDFFLSATYDSERLPFVSLAVLGTETLAFDSGFDPDSRMHEYFWDLEARHAFTPSVRVRVSLRLAWGDETVTLTDSAGVAPSRRLDVARRGVFGAGLSGSIGSPEPTLFIGADFSIGAPAR
ncbi:MAG TPA: hypothetical protein VGL03_03795 [Thermoanaerobaculia bacterium]|jgi:hypothetical protein